MVASEPLHEFWDGVRRLHLKYPDDWTPDELRSALDAGEAFLFSVPSGFIVLRDDFPKVHVWLAIAINGSATCAYNSLTAIEAIARDSGFKQITFASIRPGWRRAAKRLGFEYDGEFYSKEVPDGVEEG